MGLLEKLQNKLEVYRLEQRYTRRRNRPGIYATAQYVDGEYIYNYSPASSSTMSMSNKSSSYGSSYQWRSGQGSSSSHYR
ncbi:hypothetical protein VTN49DRAFT_7056 [Thermomyces lanuginosus]|uniref:uncharacterized protein n=1 Tax=Thermomyces lanuginosus TaxID=5541 RepID=UPI00374263A2